MSVRDVNVSEMMKCAIWSVEEHTGVDRCRRLPPGPMGWEYAVFIELIGSHVVNRGRLNIETLSDIEGDGGDALFLPLPLATVDPCELELLAPISDIERFKSFWLMPRNQPREMKRRSKRKKTRRKGNAIETKMWKDDGRNQEVSENLGARVGPMIIKNRTWPEQYTRVSPQFALSYWCTQERSLCQLLILTMSAVTIYIARCPPQLWKQ